MDTHPIHFHLYDVQLINRVAWDNNVRLPDANELGWKDTVRVNPLQDTIVALRPVIPTFPFEVPNSVRLLDPTRPEGELLKSSTAVDIAEQGMMVFDPSGEPIDIYNHYINLGWEYVWHCHILSHEEMDMMHIQMVAMEPTAPTNVSATGMSNPFRIALNWTNPALNATGFRIQRATDAGFSNNLVTIDVGLVPGYIDTNVVEGQTYYYRVAALNTVGDTWNYSDPAINEIPDGPSFPHVTMQSTYSIAAFGQPGATGLLRVQTVPAVPTTISVDGFPRNDWGLTYVKLPVGSYQLSLSDVHGFGRPTQISVTQAGVGPVVQSISAPISIVEDEITEVIINFTEYGNLHVLTDPAVPATIFVNGWPSEDWGLWTYFPAGDYTVTFGELSSWISPDPEPVTVSAGATTEVTGIYTFDSDNIVVQPPHGLFHVQTTPAVRTAISVDGHPSDDWGLTYVKMTPGSYMLTFTDVAGWKTPTHVSVVQNGGDAVLHPLSSPISIVDGEVTDVYATFVPKGNLLVETSPHLPATLFCNGQPMNDWGFWTYLDPGEYTVSFETVAGYQSPPPIVVIVEAGLTTHVVGDYGTGQTHLNP